MWNPTQSMFCRSLRSQSFCCQPLCESIRRLWLGFWWALKKYGIRVSCAREWREQVYWGSASHSVKACCRETAWIPADWRYRHFRYENGGQSGPADTVFPSTGVCPEQRDIFLRCGREPMGWKRPFKLYFCNTGAFFRECDAVFPFQSGYVWRCRCPRRSFPSIDRNVPICCIRGFRCVDGYAGQNAGNISG